MPIREVCSPISKPKGPQAGNAGKLVKVKHTAIYNSDAGPSKLSPGGRYAPGTLIDGQIMGSISVTKD
jgi:hypothetical protein